MKTSRRFLRRLVWLAADSDNLFVRRTGWRVLRLAKRVGGMFRRAGEDGRAPAAADTDTPGPGRTELVALYNALDALPQSPSGKVEAVPESGPVALKKLAVLAPTLPKFDRNSSELRVMSLLKAMSRNVSEIDYYYFTRTEFDPVYRKELPGNIACHLVRSDLAGLPEIIMSGNTSAIWITNLFDIDFFARCVELVRRLKSGRPDCKVILDTMDCHWKKYVRKALLSEQPADWHYAGRYLNLEKELYPGSDLLAVVTESDGLAIRKSIPDAPPFAVIPNCHDISARQPAFAATRGLCFVGSAGVNHNLDAMRFLRDRILPHLAAAMPSLRISVIGSRWQKYAHEFDGQPFVFRGHVSDLDQELQRYRVFVCPLTYGAGLKGKIGSAVSAGIPIVTTSIGIEGFPVRHGVECLIADDPVDFAEQCLRLLEDEALWLKLRDSFAALVQTNYSPQALERALKGALFAL